MKTKYFIILFITIILGYFSVAFLLHPLKYDFFDQFYPWKYFAASCLQNGTLPWWMPYQLGGYPIYADPQSGILYPITWLVGSIFGYSIAVIHLEFILHIFIGAVGMFYLTNFFLNNSKIALLLGIAFALSGFFVGNAQHYSYIIAGAWSPLILWSFLKLLKYGKIKYSLENSIYLTLLVTGGYSAYPIIFFYLLAVLSISYLTVQLIKKNYKWVIGRLIPLSVLLVLTLIMCAGYLLSVYHAAENITRGSGIGLESALSHALSFRAFISLLLPLATTVDYMYYFNADMSMINVYMGLVILLFIAWGIIQVKNKYFYIILLLSFIAILFSLGQAGGLRVLSYHLLPFMNYFRFPAVFRLFIIIGMLLIAGYGMQKYMQKEKDYTLLYLCIGLLILLLFVAFYTIFKYHIDILDIIKTKKAPTIFHTIVLQSLIQIVFLTGIVGILTGIKNKQRLQLFLFGIAIFDLFVATQLNSGKTMVYREFKMKDIRLLEKSFPKGFPVPDQKSIQDAYSLNHTTYCYWRNMGIFYKQIAFDGNNPFVLKRFSDFKKHTELVECLEKSTPLFFTSHYYPNNIAVHKISCTDINYFPAVLPPHVFNTITKDTITTSINADIRIKTFNPNLIEVHIKAPHEGLLVVNQNLYPGWKARLDKIPAELFLTNISFMSIKMPPGTHKVEFAFTPVKSERIAIYTSLIIFVIVTITVIYVKLKSI